MRNMVKLGALALGLAACGGGEQAGEQAPAAAPPPAETAAPAGGATHDVNMVLEGTNYVYVPAQLTISAGDRVNFHNISGGPHNVQFWPDSIPAGSADALGAGMPDQMSPLAGPLLVETNAVYSVTFANVPTGEYRFYCLPHLVNNMKGIITVR